MSRHRAADGRAGRLRSRHRLQVVVAAALLTFLGGVAGAPAALRVPDAPSLASSERAHGADEDTTGAHGRSEALPADSAQPPAAVPPEPVAAPAGGPAGQAPATEVPAAPTPEGTPDVAAAGNVPPGGMFQLLPVGSQLPSGEQCAAQVQRDPWEPRPQNTQANNTRPQGPAPYGMGTWFTPEADGAAFRGRVDGNFTGTTDEIIQWASCKWGFPADLGRAQAFVETTWDQAFVGDGGESRGLYQMRTTVWGGQPNAWRSTAFNADWAMGLRRACFEGAMWYPELRGNLEACIGVHYSGDPDESTWREYTASVLAAERSKPWLSWPSAAGRPPTADRG